MRRKKKRHYDPEESWDTQTVHYYDDPNAPIYDAWMALFNGYGVLMLGDWRQIKEALKVAKRTLRKEKLLLKGEIVEVIPMKELNRKNSNYQGIKFDRIGTIDVDHGYELRIEL